ncbi:hypothetical protein SEMRO_654_G181980.1 [Seminavis robusta]|uniref:Uncharacterized protein n=1 Tax=Seminavis robusta TaxID=568900 RepID=A0A9N8E4W0_9STRA|nr:hypothetical protein SEMRO_654_G181980.1 [Seminavis robusta]|eukprot:Sro654_g181980.1 n/a (142) ;mRNA; r:1078-1705
MEETLDPWVQVAAALDLQEGKAGADYSHAASALKEKYAEDIEVALLENRLERRNQDAVAMSVKKLRLPSRVSPRKQKPADCHSLAYAEKEWTFQSRRFLVMRADSSKQLEDCLQSYMKMNKCNQEEAKERCEEYKIVLKEN